ncbi:hypothetical protein B8X02_14910 [Stenotrophomonas rhizophila]|uniref:RNA-directed DNA polymerase n=1 Tax=Stenotrophomonas rhizophila TaxID=216778 RepID=UPI000BA512B6|nr:RNA-directed DNA polymerase [Stenotrophomonas rhizophila]PAK90827.1 hypothetical protein B8X02_14910 [Stenotrophomonas rhizophila]
MSADILDPKLDLLRKDFVLIQAWKKTSTYIRYHNWYADTLDIDRTAANLPSFIRELSSELASPRTWRNAPLRMVPAPKPQRWQVSASGAWEPLDGRAVGAKLRPLAHVDLKSQVVATAIMMCLADRVETQQGDPREKAGESTATPHLVSYGSRLFCDNACEGLRHRWGSTKIYRAYYQDYRAFVQFPERAADPVPDTDDERVVVVHSDLSQFYDRVRPSLLNAKLRPFLADADDGFKDLVANALQWSWDPRDARDVARYASESDIADFTSIALPQGLVSAGFFANVVLADFDSALRRAKQTTIEPGIRVLDCARYVDDLRIVMSVTRDISLNQVQQMVADWLQLLLDGTAPGMKVSLEKTQASAIRGEERPLVRQSQKMTRIQSAVSGGFDAIAGVEILDAVQGLIRSQMQYANDRNGGQHWALAPVPDVRDATVSRFAAARYRKTYHSLRPMLDSVGDADAEEHSVDEGIFRSGRMRTQKDLDEDARAFALGLVEAWVDDPSNVRLLRVGLDLWPSADLLDNVLGLLRPFTTKNGKRNGPRRVAWYCLAEIFRAGATETGFVDDEEALPAAVDVDAYRKRLREEAIRLASSSRTSLPWYVRQQVLLFLATGAPKLPAALRIGTGREVAHYRELIKYLRGDTPKGTVGDIATLSVLARRSFLGRDTAVALALPGATPRRLEQVAERDPAFAVELVMAKPELAEGVSPRTRDDLCLQAQLGTRIDHSLATIVLGKRDLNALRNELSLLSFSIRFLDELRQKPSLDAVCPGDVLVDLGDADDHSARQVTSVRIHVSRVGSAGSIYQPPDWSASGQRWRFQLGYLLRFILTARQDFTERVAKAHWKAVRGAYRPCVSHWYQRLHALFNGHEAFGDDWLPISEWIEQFLSTLLRWPGQSRDQDFLFVEEGLERCVIALEKRLAEVLRLAGPTSKLLMLPLRAAWSTRPAEVRPLRACIVQTVFPADNDFDKNDLTCSATETRRKHRRHLSTALAAVERMLDLRETHVGKEGRLDWLILPELAVHPTDVATHLIPFARAHKAIILAGLTYEELFSGKPLVNSALWILPVWDPDHGLQVRVRRQGKGNLAPLEASLNDAGPLVQGFRPCQWLVGYEWAHGDCYPPLWLSAAICYDATDLALAADLRNRSDVFAVPALNSDVGTFDQMSLALHYHMFQMVVVANNGKFGGSSAYAPYKEHYKKRVFHMHGQPQASIAFLEIDPIALFQQRKKSTVSGSKGEKKSAANGSWKSPPAGVVGE